MRRGVGRDAGADDVEPVEGGLRGDGIVRAAHSRTMPSAMTSSKCLAIRWRSLMRPTRMPMAAASRSVPARHARPRCARGPPRWPPAARPACAPAPPRGPGCGRPRGARPGSRGELISTRSRSSNSESWRVPSVDEALDGGCPQGAHPADAAHLAQALDARGGEHAPVAHEHEPLEAEAVAQLPSWVSSVAGSAVFPLKASTATGRPSASVSRPNTTWGRSARWSRL